MSGSSEERGVLTDETVTGMCKCMSWDRSCYFSKGRGTEEMRHGGGAGTCWRKTDQWCLGSGVDGEAFESPSSMELVTV